MKIIKNFFKRIYIDLRLFVFIFFSLASSILLAATPIVSNGIQSEQLPGKAVCFNADFINSGSPGFGPYIRLILPPELSFSSSSIPSLGLSVSSIDAGVFLPPTNELLDTLSLDTANNITGPENSHLYLLELPIGSVVAGGPPVVVEICSTLETSAEISVPVNISTQGMYRFGDSATANAEDTIAGAVDTEVLTPVLAILEKNSNAAESERVPGSSFPFNYSLNVEIAESKTIDDLFLTDTPDFSGLSITTPATVSGMNCVVDNDINNGTPMSIHCDPVTGAASTSDITAVFGSYVNDILNPNVCSAQSINNLGELSGLYQGIAFSENKIHTLSVKHAAIQSSVSSSSIAPGDIVTFTSNFQINEFNAANNIAVVETLSDGLEFIPGSAQLSLNGGGAALIVPALIINGDGSETLTFSIPGPQSDSNATISYQVQVATFYSSGLPVMANDELSRSTAINYDIVGGANACSDNSGSTLQVSDIVTNKVLLNPQAEYLAGDVVEFLLRLQIPPGFVQDIVFEDFLPLPVLDATTIDTNTNINANANFSFDSADTVGENPSSITFNAATNSIKLQWDSIRPQSANPNPIYALRLAIPIENVPFSDGLKLTNLVTYQAHHSEGILIEQQGSAAFVARAPLLSITKGIAATDKPTGILTPAVATPVDSDLSEVEAGNRVDYVITVENQGGDAAANVFVIDTPPSGLNNCVVDSVLTGEGTPLAVSPSTDALFTSGFTIDHYSVDIINTQASLAANDGSIGAPYAKDTALISYHCELALTVYPQQTIENTASAHWSNLNSTVNYPDITDTAIISIASSQISKTISQVLPLSNSTGDLTTTTVGDIVEYEISVTLPEGTTEELTLTDTLPFGYLYQTGTLSYILDPGGMTLDNPPTANATSNILTINNAGSTVVVADGNLSNNTITYRFNVLVVDDPANEGSSHQQLKRNVVSLNYNNKPPGTISAIYDNHFVEPVVAIVKTINPEKLEGGDIATVRLEVTNTGTSPMYDVLVTDILNEFGNVVDLAEPITEVITPGNYLFDFTLDTVSYAMTSGSLLPGQTSVFEFSVTINAGVVTGSQFKNDAYVTGYSQPASAATPVVRVTSDKDSDNFIIAKLGLSKQLVFSTELFTSDKDNEVAIGEILTFRLTFVIPKNTTTLASKILPFVHDILPEGYQYIDGTVIAYANNTGISYSIDPANETPDSPSPWPLIPTTATSADPSPFFTVSNQNRELEFAFGNMHNSNIGSDKDKLIIEYQVQVLNHSANKRGEDKTNRVQVNYLNNNRQEQHFNRSLTTIITEPNLMISKLANPKSVVAGQTVTYTITLTNESASHATYGWEPELVDRMLQSKFNVPVLIGASMSRGGQDLSACVSISSPLLVHTINLDLSLCLPANERFLAPGEAIILEYSADAAMNALFEDELKNTVVGSTTSLPGDFGTSGSGILGAPGDADGKRTGELTSSVNDLQVFAQESVFVNKPVITKESDASLQIGDIHFQTLSISIPPGSTRNFVVTDNLPTGLYFDAQTVNLVLPAGLNISTSPQTTWPAGSTSLVFNFGDIINTLATAVKVDFEYQVRVDNVLSNQQGVQLINVSQLDYDGANTPSSDNAEVDIIEPDIALLKEITTGATGSVAGSLIGYRVTLSNNSLVGSAYQLNLVDIMPEDLTTNLPSSFEITLVDNIGDKILNESNGLPLTAADAIIQSSIVADDTLTWPMLTLPPKSTLVIEYQVKVDASALAGDQLTNTVTADYNSQSSGSNGRDGSNGSGGLNDYTSTTSATLTLDANIAIAKFLDPSQPSNKFSIGDEVLYDVIIHVQEGTTNSVVISDTLPIGIAFESLLGIQASHNISFNGPGDAIVTPLVPDPLTTTNVSIDLDTVVNIADGDVNNDFLIARIKGIVEDNTPNVQGLILTNSALVNADAGGAISDGPVIVDIELVEPNLEIIKTTSNATPPINGSFTYTIEVKHNNSFSDAREIVLTDAIPAGLSYIVGSTIGQAIVDESDPDNPVFALGDITLADGSKQFQFDVSVDSGVTPSVPITNIMQGVYKGQPSSHAPLPIRTYNTSGQVDVTPIAANFIYAVKTVALSGDMAGNGINNSGDVMTYTVTILNKHTSALSNVIFEDTISTLVDYVPGSLTTTHGADNSPSLTNLEVQVGTLPAGASAIITYQVLIKDNILDGTLVYNQGHVNSSETAVKPTDWDGIEANGYQPTEFPVYINSLVSPDIYVQKGVTQLIDADSSGGNSPEDTMRYQFIITNDGVNELTDVTVDDTIPAGLSYVSNSVSASPGALATVTGNNLSISIATLAPGTHELAFFDVTIDKPLYNNNPLADPDTETFLNQAMVNANEISPTYSDGDNNKSNGNQSTQFTASSDGVTGGVGGGSGLLSPLITKKGARNIWPTVDWTVEIMNSFNSAVLPVHVSDPLPTDTTYSAASLSCTTPSGSVSIITQCEFNSASNSIEVSAHLGSELGLIDFDLAQHKVTIIFSTTSSVANARSFINTANGFWDANNSGSASDDQASGQSPIMASAAVGAPPKNVPTLSFKAIILLSLLLLVFSHFYLTQQRRVS